jgi:hypothetical protein
VIPGLPFPACGTELAWSELRICLSLFARYLNQVLAFRSTYATISPVKRPRAAVGDRVLVNPERVALDSSLLRIIGLTRHKRILAQGGVPAPPLSYGFAAQSSQLQ